MGAAHMAYAAATEALKATGIIVRVTPDVFVRLVSRAESPLVVVGQGGVFKKHFQYLTSYKGLAFFTTSPAPLVLPKAEVIAARSIAIPDI